MSEARYWIARYIDDLFRDEPRNVGVLVELDGRTSARFKGETGPGVIDRRRIRHDFSYPDVYCQWVDYWRHALSEGLSGKEDKASKDHFRLIDGGFVGNIEDDTVRDVAEYLFQRLVLGSPEENIENHPVRIMPKDFRRSVRSVLRSRGLLDREELSGSRIKYPVHSDVPVKGKKTVHRLEYVQRNGHLRAIQLLDFTKKTLSQVVDHAGLAAYKFRDIKDQDRNMEAISIVMLDRNVEQLPDELHYGFEIVESESRVVEWQDERAQDQFVGELIMASRES